jgi:hypothetical protein
MTTTMTLTAAITTIDWLGMRLRVPAEWTIVRHNVSPQRGRLTLVDRRRQRLMLAWSPSDQVPDWDRMLGDQQALDAQRDDQPTFERQHGRCGWEVLRRTTATGALVRAARYDRARRRVIELVMPVRDVDDVADEVFVLEGFDVLDAEGEEARQWRAFDMQVMVPEDWTLAAVEANLGSTRATFAHGRAELHVRRLSMADTWFRGDLERFLRKELKDAQAPWDSVFHAGHPACRHVMREHGPRIKAMMGLLRERVDLAWHEPRANAVMHLTLLRPRGMNLDVDAFNILCLDSLSADA